MKGLLIKDFKYIAKHHLGFLFVSALFFCMSVFSDASVFFCYYSVAMISLMPVFTMAYDEAYKWSKYEAVIPVKKHLIVLEKYILVFIASIPAIFIETAIFHFYKKTDPQTTASLACMMLFISLLSPAVVLPLNFRFGYLKGKLINIIVIAVMAASITAINMKNSIAQTAIEKRFTPLPDAQLFAVFALIIISVSIFISVMLYKKREY